MAKYPVQAAESLPDAFGIMAEVRLKNSALVSAREKLGLTQYEAAEKIGISAGTLSSYENMRSYPLEKTQRMICKFYRKRRIFLLEEDVFPEQLRAITDRPSKYIRDVLIPKQKLLSLSEVSPRELPAVEPGQVAALEQDELSEGMSPILDTLTDRERQAVTMRYGLDGGGERSYEQIGKELKVTGSMVGNIMNGVMKKLRHPVRSKTLAEFLDTDNPQGDVTKVFYNR